MYGYQGCSKRRTPGAEAAVHPRARAESQNLDPVGKPEQPVSWYKLDPGDALDPWRDSEEPELPGIPVTLGPAPRSGPPAYNPMSVQAPGFDVASLAAQLNWKV